MESTPEIDTRKIADGLWCARWYDRGREDWVEPEKRWPSEEAALEAARQRRHV